MDSHRMKPSSHRLTVRPGSLTGGTLAALLTAAPALAGSPGSITFIPGSPTSIPTLGTAVLVLLALLLGVMGWASLRKNGAGATSAILLAAALTAGGGAGGLQWFERVQAAGSSYPITNAGGQTFMIDDGDINFYNNNTTIPMQPSSITLGGCPLTTTPRTCTVGTPVEPGENCEMDCTSDSDRRLKENIVYVGTAANGLPLYEYSYRGESAVFRGVMAQDVLFHTPAAVHLRPTGYLAVDYGMLGINMLRLE